MDDALREQIARLSVLEMELPELVEEQWGQVVLHPDDVGAWDVVIMRKSGLGEEGAATFDAWARERVYMALTVGPEIDGWFPRKSDGGWQITGRAVDMPLDPFM